MGNTDTPTEMGPWLYTLSYDEIEEKQKEFDRAYCIQGARMFDLSKKAGWGVYWPDAYQIDLKYLASMRGYININYDWVPGMCVVYLGKYKLRYGELIVSYDLAPLRASGYWVQPVVRDQTFTDQARGPFQTPEEVAAYLHMMIATNTWGRRT